MAKMFYTTEEAAGKIGVSVDGLKQLVTDNKLREFRDGARVMFKVDQVDRLANEKNKPTADSIGLSDTGIALSPSGSGSSDVISLSDSSAPATAKDDTVVTGQGVNVLGSGEVKPSEAAAQTQIQSAIDDQLSLEGVGSGSGLLDLTRESDDTSLGAELLDEIYPGGEGKGGAGTGGSSSGIFEQPVAAESSGPSGLENMASAPVNAPVGIADIVEEVDSSSGAFGGMALAAILIMGMALLVVGASLQKFTPSWVEPITADTTKIVIFSVVLVVTSALFAGFGFFIGKATSR